MSTSRSDRGRGRELPGGRKYLYRQLADEMRESIRAGRYAPGERLPSLDDLASHHRLNRITVIKALAELRREGLVRSVPAQGTYVADTPPRAPRKGLLTVGLVSHVLHPTQIGPYHTQIVTGIQEALGKASGLLVVMPAMHIDQPARTLELMNRANLDAVIYLGPFDPAVLRQMVKSGPPSVLVDFQVRGVNDDAILVDNRGGGYQAVEHLLSLGHRDIALVLGPEDQIASRDRLAGAQEALDQFGVALRPEWVIGGQFNRESGAEAMATLLGRSPLPTAVFCMNDEMAIGALHYLEAHSALQVPRDLAMVGFDDIPSATATSPHLSTIHVETVLMGRMAVERLIDSLNAPAHTPMTTIIPTRLVARASSVRP